MHKERPNNGPSPAPAEMYTHVVGLDKDSKGKQPSPPPPLVSAQSKIVPCIRGGGDAVNPLPRLVWWLVTCDAADVHDTGRLVLTLTRLFFFGLCISFVSHPTAVSSHHTALSRNHTAMPSNHIPVPSHHTTLSTNQTAMSSRHTVSVTSHCSVHYITPCHHITPCHI